MNIYKQISAKINPPKAGWYNTSRGELFWYESESAWSCRDDKLSQEFPSYWYQETSNNRESSVWIPVSERLPEYGETVLVYCKIYGRFLATYEFIGDFKGEKYGNWADFKGKIGILPPVYWMQIPELPEL